MRRVFLQMPYMARQHRKFICFKEGDPGEGGGGTASADDDDFTPDPNKDLTKEFAAAAPAGKTVEELAAEKAIADKAASDAAEAERVKNLGNGTATDFYKPFEHLTKKYQGLEIPKAEEVTPENMYDLFEQTIVKNLDVSSLLDPKVAQLQAKIESGIPFEKAIENYIPNSQMTEEQRVTAYIKEKYELDDTKAAEYVKDANIKKEVLEADLYFKRKSEFQQREQEIQNRQQFELNAKQQKESLENDIVKTLGNFEKKAEVWGTKLSETDKTEFKKTYRNWVTPGENGEPAPIVALLHNDDFLADVIFYASQPGRVKDLLDKEKEELRTFYKKRLALEPDRQQSGQTANDNGTLDLNKMRAPATNED